MVLRNGELFLLFLKYSSFVIILSLLDLNLFLLWLLWLIRRLNRYTLNGLCYWSIETTCLMWVYEIFWFIHLHHCIWLFSFLQALPPWFTILLTLLLSVLHLLLILLLLIRSFLQTQEKPTLTKTRAIHIAVPQLPQWLRCGANNIQRISCFRKKHIHQSHLLLLLVLFIRY